MPGSDLIHAVLLAAIAGVTIPLGGAIAAIWSVRRDDIPPAIRHAIVAFGAGALLSAVALVLVPDGVQDLPPWLALVCLAAGGVVFMQVDRALSRKGGSSAQLLAMLLDFLPEAAALGALLATNASRAILLALMIALQNLPEAFNAFRDLKSGAGTSARAILLRFAGLALLGPVAAAVGILFLSTHVEILGAVMLFAAGGILYLMFADIAPKVPLDDNWAPPLGAVAGFLLGLAGYLYLP